jgi:hypothetical protein
MEVTLVAMVVPQHKKPRQGMGRMRLTEKAEDG